VALVGTEVLEEHIASVLLCNVVQLLVTANVPSSKSLSTLMIEAIYSSEMSVPIRAAQHHIPEGSILHQQSYVPPLMPDTKFHTHTESQAKL
jgi:hypothetical protein